MDTTVAWKSLFKNKIRSYRFHSIISDLFLLSTKFYVAKFGFLQVNKNDNFEM